ncbi:hypothetical protein K3495_g10722 [Podosphaera aphanis]|nr:hypothetical protein K3495_g10722 [Podosphaera aphanis]
MDDLSYSLQLTYSSIAMVVEVLCASTAANHYRTEDVVTIDGRYIDEAGNIDIDLRVTVPKLHVVDAPTGAEKIELLASFREQNFGLSILLISFRWPLAENLAERFGRNAYTSKDIWSDATAKKLLSICVDSTVRLLSFDRYDVVLVD